MKQRKEYLSFCAIFEKGLPFITRMFLSSELTIFNTLIKKGSGSRHIGQNNLLDNSSTVWSALLFLVCSSTRFTASNLWRPITQIIKVNPPPPTLPFPPKNKNNKIWMKTVDIGHWKKCFWYHEWYPGSFSAVMMFDWIVLTHATASKKIFDNEVITISLTPVGLNFRRICHRGVQPSAYLHLGTFWNRDKTISYWQQNILISLSAEMMIEVWKRN